MIQCNQGHISSILFYGTCCNGFKILKDIIFCLHPFQINANEEKLDDREIIKGFCYISLVIYLSSSVCSIIGHNPPHVLLNQSAHHSGLIGFLSCIQTFFLWTSTGGKWETALVMLLRRYQRRGLSFHVYKISQSCDTRKTLHHPP